MEVDGQMHSTYAKIADLVKEHLQTREKTKMGGGVYEQGVEREMERRREQICFCSILLPDPFSESFNIILNC
jgi:hypothetical protein